MDKIITLSRDEFKIIKPDNLKCLDSGTEGAIYPYKKGYVLKHLRDEELELISGNIKEDYMVEKIIQFSNVENDSYYFTKSVIVIEKLVEAVIMKRCPGFNLITIDPLSINIINLIEAIKKFNIDTKIVSNLSIQGYDMLYNFMYDGKNFGAIDTIHYFYSDKDLNSIYRSNIVSFNTAVVYALTKRYFSVFINENNYLKNNFRSITTGEDLNIINFIEEFIRKLSEYCDRKIIYLDDAKLAIRERHHDDYPTELATNYLKR